MTLNHGFPPPGSSASSDDQAEKSSDCGASTGRASCTTSETVQTPAQQELKQIKSMIGELRLAQSTARVEQVDIKHLPVFLSLNCIELQIPCNWLSIRLFFSFFQVPSYAATLHFQILFKKLWLYQQTTSFSSCLYHKCYTPLYFVIKFQLLAGLDTRVGRLEKQLEMALNSIYTLVQLQTGINSSVTRFREEACEQLKTVKAILSESAV